MVPELLARLRSTRPARRGSQPHCTPRPAFGSGRRVVDDARRDGDDLIHCRLCRQEEHSCESTLVDHVRHLHVSLALGSVLRNADYFDEIGLVLVALTVLVLNRTRISPRLALVVISLLTAIAVACEEFLLLFLAPFVVVAALRCLDLPDSPARGVVARRLVRPLGLAL